MKLNPDVVSCEYAGGAALLNLSTNMYYALNDVGLLVWTELQSGKSVDDIEQVLVQRYGIDRERSSTDVRNLVEQMRAADLIH